MENGKALEIKHILGVDFGTSNVGLSLADTETRIAFAFGVLKNNNELWRDLEKIVAQENIQQVVVGVPGYALTEKEKNEHQIFGEQLAKKFAVEVAYAEEMFTTQSAHKNLQEAQKKNVGKNDDAESARIILQDWLDKFSVNH